MATSSTSVTASEIMDRSAVLMNDPLKTDYNYEVLLPFLRMALDELTESLVESQSSPTIQTSSIIILPMGYTELYSIDSLNDPHYPSDLVEIQEIGERLAESDDSFIPMKRSEYIHTSMAGDRLLYWAWENQIIKFNPNGATTNRELQLKYIRDFSSTIVEAESIVGSINSRSFLSYKTAAYASMFIGENHERARVLEIQAELSLERIHGINNKGKQQIMTRHRPFRANWKARGGF